MDGYSCLVQLCKGANKIAHYMRDSVEMGSTSLQNAILANKDIVMWHHVEKCTDSGRIATCSGRIPIRR